jgi:hypothetical protein
MATTTARHVQVAAASKLPNSFPGRASRTVGLFGDLHQTNKGPAGPVVEMAADADADLSGRQLMIIRELLVPGEPVPRQDDDLASGGRDGWLGIARRRRCAGLVQGHDLAGGPGREVELQLLGRESCAEFAGGRDATLKPTIDFGMFGV